MTTTAHPHVLIVGSGISGAACANSLRARGVAVTVRDRGRAPGGRMSSPSLHGRPIDLGAAYFTVGDDDFRSIVHGWAGRGMAREWTDTLEVFDGSGRGSKQGAPRWAARDGLRSLVRDLQQEVALGVQLSEIPTGYDAVVLAMPDPQAARLVPASAGVGWVDYEPVIAVAAGWAERAWSLDAAFVNDDPDLSLIADDGARRDDGAPVLVLHSTSDRAREHLDAPDAAIAPMVAAARRLLDLADDPAWTHAHRWTFARPATTHGDAPFGLLEGLEGVPTDLLGLCGDSWCPEGSPRVEAAWLSGRRLGLALAARLT